MQIDVLRELRQSIGAVSVVDFEEDDVSADDLDLRGFSGSVSMLRTDRGLLVTLNAEARAQESCSRCLKNVDVPIEIAFEEEYVPDTFRIGPDFILDLREGVRQYILMSEPAKPLCRADCRGLCPSCGADLNEGACKCATERDSRWEALAGLKTENEGS
jgi:uncharacterized protein